MWSCRSCASFGYDGQSKHEVSLSPSVSTNTTELSLIFTKLLGIRSTELATTNEKHVKVLSSGNSGDVVELDSFLSKRLVMNDSYLCQGVNLIFPMCCMQFISLKQSQKPVATVQL